jgi:hypothetical protein
MASPRMTFPEDEFWDCVDELPHLTDRVLFLHRQNGLSIEQIAKRLGIEQKERPNGFRGACPCSRLIQPDGALIAGSG